MLDFACCLILQRSKIPAVVLSGSDMSNFSNYVNGYSFTGTVIHEIENDIIGESSLVEKMDEINQDIPQKKRRKKSPKKGMGGYEPPNPYQIDY